jgi:hypothetical protein
VSDIRFENQLYGEPLSTTGVLAADSSTRSANSNSNVYEELNNRIQLKKKKEKEGHSM